MALYTLIATQTGILRIERATTQIPKSNTMVGRVFVCVCVKCLYFKPETILADL